MYKVHIHVHVHVGLRREDLYMEDDPVVSEAIRRLPQEERDLRLFRLKRALDLSLKKALLPKDQWTSDEEVSIPVSIVTCP